MRLITFGDSWTAGHGVETEKQYKEFEKKSFFSTHEQIMQATRISVIKLFYSFPFYLRRLPK